MPHQKPNAPILQLVDNPRRLASAIEHERAVRRGAPGWLGITRRSDEQAVLDLDGDEVFVVDVHERSLAYRSGLRSGLLMKGGVHVQGRVVLLDDFETARYPAGTEIGIRYYRHSTGRHGKELLSTYFKLSPWPRVRPWETQPRVANGRRIMKADRPKFLAKMIPYLRDAIGSPRSGTKHERRTSWLAAYAFLSYLVLIRDNDNNPGVWPRQSESADALGLSVRTVNDLTQMLCWFGVLNLLEPPKRGRDSNLYDITEPLPNRPRCQPAPVPPPPAASTSRIRRIRL
jgi:hypothetical protein